MPVYSPVAMALDDERIVTVEINKGTMVKLSRPAASILVSDPLTADVQVISPKMVFVRGKKIGETSFYALDAENEQIMSAVVDVTHNISNLERAVKRSIPGADVSFKTVDGGLVMDGNTATMAESEDIRNIASTFIGSTDKMINLIKTAGSDQVMLKVKIVEMQRNDLKKLGISLQSIVEKGNLSLQMANGTPITFTNNLLNRVGTSDANIFGNINTGGVTNVGGFIDALETNGFVTTLAEPNLTTTSGKAASFLAGGQFPIPVPGQNGTVTVQYQPFGVSLNFTPVVMSHDRISMTVAPSVSNLDFSAPIQVAGFNYPIIDTRQASSVVELGSGDSFMMAGLLQSNTSNDINKFPALGDLPVLGALFRSTQFHNNQTELVILVTPYIVHPVAEASRLQTPIDGFVAPSELEMLLKGNLYRQQPMQDNNNIAPPMPKLHGEGGFILE